MQYTLNNYATTKTHSVNGTQFRKKVYSLEKYNYSYENSMLIANSLEKKVYSLGKKITTQLNTKNSMYIQTV